MAEPDADRHRPGAEPRRTRYAHWEYFYDRARLLAVPAIARHFEALDVDVSAVFPQSSLVALRRR